MDNKKTNKKSRLSKSRLDLASHGNTSIHRYIDRPDTYSFGIHFKTIYSLFFIIALHPAKGRAILEVSWTFIWTLID
jgi:hypothetical protein